MKRSRARFTRMIKSNHHQAFRQPFKCGGARKPPSSSKRGIRSRLEPSEMAVIVLVHWNYSFVRSNNHGEVLIDSEN